MGTAADPSKLQPTVTPPPAAPSALGASVLDPMAQKRRLMAAKAARRGRSSFFQPEPGSPGSGPTALTAFGSVGSKQTLGG